jgi:hypothetical protein
MISSPRSPLITLDLAVIAPVRSALLTLSEPERRYLIQTNGIMRPIECPRNRMALSSRGPTRSMEYVRGCRLLAGDQSSVPPDGPHGDWADEPL